MMRTAKKGLFLLLGTVFLTTGCTASLKSYPYGMMDTNVELKDLKRSQIEVLGSVEGSAHYSRFLCFGGIDNGDREFNGNLRRKTLFMKIQEMDLALAESPGMKQLTTAEATMFGMRKQFEQGKADIKARMVDELSPVEQAATYDAMEKQPDADGLINLIITKGERTSFGWLYADETVTVRATAIKIKAG